MTDWLSGSLVLVSDYRVPDPAQVWPLLQRRTDALAGLGAHHVLVYTSTTDPERVLVILVIHAHEPVLDVLRSRVFFDWFDAVGVADLPAVFAGELVDRIDLDGDLLAGPPQVIVSMVTPVADVPGLSARVRESAGAFRSAGVRRFWSFTAFDDPGEVLILQQVDDESGARRWLHDSDDAAAWLTEAGVGAYPPVFIGRFGHMMAIEPGASR
ncbi:fatty-acid--CoA ligase [Mycobacterium sp. BMJ-28]